MIEKQQHIDWIKHRIEVENFAVKDFLLTALPLRPPARERRRRAIAQQMFRLDISAHDLVRRDVAARRAARISPHHDEKETAS